MMLKKKPHGITVVHNDSLFFIAHDASGAAEIVHHLQLKTLLSLDGEPSPLPPESGFTKNSLLIVPDYWFGSSVYLLHSKQRAVIQSFIERKLQTDHPDLPEASLFYDYTSPGEGKLFVNFLQDPECFKLYHRLEAMGVSPENISTPAFLWARRLEAGLPDFKKSGCCLVHLTAVEAFLYFFSQGRFLFSRSIAFPKSLEDSSDKLNALAYEINQSTFLFSQKAKSELSHIRMVAPDPDDIVALSSHLDREISAFDVDHETEEEKRQFQSDMGAVLPFGAKEIGASNRFVHVSHKLKKKALEWKPLQLAGITLGLILVLLLCVESFFLWRWPPGGQNPPVAAEGTSPADPRTILSQYADALDLAIAATSRRSLKEAFASAIEATPETVSIVSMTIELEPEPHVIFKCEVRTGDITTLRETLDVFIEKVDTAFSGKGLVSKPDIKISAVNEKQADQGYLIEFKVNIP
ncbi:MAG: hypothetical protein V2B19_22250 [Pseudomonadota bacterium]